MQKFSMFLCFVMVAILLLMIIEEGWPNDWVGSIMIIGFISAQVIIFITLKNSHKSQDDDGLFSLYLQRKTLEEKEKVQKLKDSIK